MSAGVAHEIRNPLQFVKNFAESSGLMAEQLADAVADKERLASHETQAEIAELSADLTENMTRIAHHSDRADRIVSDMLNLRRESEREFRPADINRLLEEQTMLAFHAARAQTPGFNADIQKELDPAAGDIDAVPEDLGRVFINMVSNACQALQEKRKSDATFSPALRLKTVRTAEGVEISVRDNGIGMSTEGHGQDLHPLLQHQGRSGHRARHEPLPRHRPRPRRHHHASVRRRRVRRADRDDPGPEARKPRLSPGRVSARVVSAGHRGA